MKRLVELLSELVEELETALREAGRGDMAAQLREVEIGQWAYDPTCHAVYLSV
jgi:hypothetical protein